MVTLLIVDDEEIIREGLSSKIPWEELGITVLGTAADGEEALRVIKTQRPDIVLADIRMPKLDGLMLAQKLNVVTPDTKVVLLTGYSDFEYAQQAIQLGVKEYLLKPVDTEKLTQCIVTLRDIVLKEQQGQVEKEQTRRHIIESLPFLKNWFFTSLEAKTLTQDNIHQKLRFLNVDLDEGWFLPVVVTIDDIIFTREDDRQYFLYKIFNSIVKMLTDNKGIKILPFFESMVFTITLSFPKETEKKELLKVSFAAANAVKDYLDYNLNGSYTIGMGRLIDSLLDLEWSHSQAVEACKHRFYLGENQIIHIQDVEPISNQSYYQAIDEGRLVSAIKVGNESEAARLINELFADFTERQADIETVKRTCLEMVVFALRALGETAEPTELFTAQSDPWLLVGKQTTVEQLNVLVLDTVKKAINYLADHRQNKIQKIVHKVKEIINATYADNITLESIAEAVSLSPCYLSNIFSQEMKLTLKEYLIQTRLAAAQKLLRDINLKIYEVAEKVGYTDSRYFSQIFKKYVGVTPVQYRDLNG